ncbi:MAG: type II/IV secretion system protein [Deltaproteobacteria bacterium]|nr:type II/IV secretion system protein [Deltaproteobacteria bacterium]
MLSLAFKSFIKERNIFSDLEQIDSQVENLPWERITTELAKELKLSIFRPDPLYLATVSSVLGSECFEKIPLETWRTNLSFLIEHNELDVKYCCVDPFNLEWSSMLKFALAKQVSSFLVTYPDLIRIYQALQPSFQVDYNVIESAYQETRSSRVRRSENDSESIVVKFLDQLISEAFSFEASDIHIIPGEKNSQVKLRVNGELKDRIKIPNKLARAIATRLKSLANLDIASPLNPQDGSIKYDDGLQIRDLRFSFIPSDAGESLVIRILGSVPQRQKLNDLGLNEQELLLIKNQLNRCTGIIVVAGPTGAGKTTTLYAMLQHLNDGTKKIITIEDPIEYRFEGISQFQVNEKAGLTFNQLLKSSLRHDPDVILVGELREHETAKMCIQAAQTGHLVLTTVHANSATGVITRLLGLGLQREDLSSVLNLIVCQRLVKSLREKRVAVFSILEIDNMLAKLIASGANELTLEEKATEKGYKSLYKKALGLVDEGLIDKSEAEKLFDHRALGIQSKNVKPAVLLVEDNEETLWILTKILEDRYFNVLTARDGIEALEIITSTSLDLIISDIMMPRMSGIELIKRVRTSLGLKQIPILMLTAVDTDENELKSLELGADDFVSKLDDPNIIIARVERLLARRANL